MLWFFKLKLVFAMFLCFNKHSSVWYSLYPPELLVNNGLDPIVLALHDLALHVLLINCILHVVNLHYQLFLFPVRRLLFLTEILALLHFYSRHLVLSVKCKFLFILLFGTVHGQAGIWSWSYAISVRSWSSLVRRLLRHKFWPRGRFRLDRRKGHLGGSPFCGTDIVRNSYGFLVAILLVRKLISLPLFWWGSWGA